jgi:hypothetical protein
MRAKVAAAARTEPLPRTQWRQARGLDGGRVNEDVLAAGVGREPAVASDGVEPLHRADGTDPSPGAFD